MAVPKTLAELTYMVASELKSVRQGFVTTGTSSSSFTDTGRLESADYWNSGPVWCINTTDSLAPIGQWSTISDFAAGGVFTLLTALTATWTAGDTYAVGRRRFPLDIIIQQTNAAYRELGKVPEIDATLVTAQDTTEYTIPDAAIEDLREVWLQTDDTEPKVKGWVKIPRGEWRQELDTLYVPQYSEDYNIKLVYVAEPPLLADYDDAISPYVHPNRIIYKAAANCLMWRSDKINSTSVQNAINQRVNYLLDLDQRAKYEFPIVVPKRDNKLFMVSFTGDRDDSMEVVTKIGYVHLG